MWYVYRDETDIAYLPVTNIKPALDVDVHTYMHNIHACNNLMT